MEAGSLGMSNLDIDPAGVQRDQVAHAHTISHIERQNMSSAVPELDAMLADLEQLVTTESFSADHRALAESAHALATIGTRLLGQEPELLLTEGITHVRWRFDEPRVLLLGHHDTVWPIGSLRAHPWSIREGIATGPGIFDMKAGLIQLLYAVAALPPQQRQGICILVTGDEETDGATSRSLIEDTARSCRATLVLEPSADNGALKTVRKGAASYEIIVTGRAAHAGLEPEKGVNAGTEAAHQILALSTLQERANQYANADERTTITPTLVSVGTTRNTVPDTARITVDVRVPSRALEHRVNELVRSLNPVHPDARVTVTGGATRPPLETANSAALFALAQEHAAVLGIGPLRAATVGGVSDGNLTAGVGCPTLDGLGAVGGGAHAEDEHIIISHLPDRSRLLSALISQVNK